MVLSMRTTVKASQEVFHIVCMVLTKQFISTNNKCFDSSQMLKYKLKTSRANVIEYSRTHS